MQTTPNTPKELNAFALRYANELRQDITKYDLLRKLTMYLIALGTAVIVGVWYWFSLADFGTSSQFLSIDFFQTTIIMLLVGSSTILGGLHAFSAYVRRSTKRKVFPALAQSLGWQYTSNESAHLPLGLFSRYEILPADYNWSKTQNHLVGKIDEVAFMAFDLKLTRRGDKNKKSNVFKGTVFAFQFPSKFAAQTVLLEDKGWFNRSKLKVEKRPGWSHFSHTRSDTTAENLERVIIADPVFEKKFEAYGSDQVEARVLLTPDFIENMVALEASIYGKNLRCAFVGNKLLISIKEPAVKNPVKLITSISADFLVHSLMQEAVTILRIARRVAGRKNSFQRTMRTRREQRQHTKSSAA